VARRLSGKVSKSPAQVKGSVREVLGKPD